MKSRQQKIRAAELLVGLILDFRTDAILWPQ